MARRIGWTLVLAGSAVLASGCGSEDASGSATGGSLGFGGAPASGGTPSGGALASEDGGIDGSATGGAATGGAATGGAAAGTATGGAPTGGTATGGTGTGGAPTGGTAAGGTATGGTATGGAGTGGAATGGGNAGGTGTGGSDTGGSTTGGTATGGSDTGGSTTGGTATGGSDTGGAATGGTATGGAATGGAATGGEGACPLALEGFATVNADGQDGTYGGRDGQVVTVSNQADLNLYATATEPYTIRVQGAITLSPKGTEIRVASDKTIIGVGTTGEIVQGGFFLAAGVHNVILRNLVIRDAFVEGDWEGDTNDFDGVQMDTAHHVWIDHCHFHHMGDGIIDSRMDTTYLTVSWNILSDHNKAFGIGWTENVTAQMTIHHNWLRDTNQRNPSTDNVLRAHLYNNFLQRVAAYGNYARGGTNMILENSVFDTVNDPHYADTGSLVASGNIYRNVTGQQETLGSAFFDPSTYYTYTLDPASEVEALLAECAGPRPELGL